MTRKTFSMRRFVFVILAVALIFIAGPSAFSKKGEPVQYDFDRPEEVFKTTLAETVVGKGIDQEVLSRVLRTGQAVIVNNAPKSPDIPWMTTEGILINAPRKQVYDMVQDIPSYPEYVPQCDKAYKKHVTDNIDLVTYELGIQILFVKIKVPYSVYHYNQPRRRVDWIKAEGEFVHNRGAYEMVPVPGEDERSMLFYTSYSLPRNAVVKSLFNRVPNLDMMINLSTGTIVMKAMKDRAEGLYEKESRKSVDPLPRLELLELAREHPETLAKLAGRGLLVMLEYTEPRFYTGAAVVDKPVDSVYDSIADIEGMSEVQKQVSMEVLERDERSARVSVHTVIPLMIDFESEYVLDYRFEPPNRISFKQGPGGDIEGVAGSWELIELKKDKTLVLYRNTSDLRSSGFMMRQLLKIEPAFEAAIQASQTMYVVSDMKMWCEASPEE